MAFQVGPFQTNFQQEGAVVAATPVGAYGNWDAFGHRPRRKKKGGTVIRRSDFESLAKYEEALRAALRPIPMSDVPLDGNVIGVEEEDEDEVLLMALTRLLH